MNGPLQFALAAADHAANNRRLASGEEGNPLSAATRTQSSPEGFATTLEEKAV